MSLLLYPHASLRRSLVAYWRMEEASGTRFDGSGHGNALTSVNGVGQAAGVIGNAASFASASSQYLSGATNPSLQVGGGSFTVACWAWASQANRNGSLVSMSGVMREGFSLLQLGTAWSFLTSSDGSAGNFVFRSASVTIAPATWYFVVAWYDAAGGTTNIQVNNGSVMSGSVAGVYNNTTDPLQVGFDTYNGIYHDGRIDECGLWNRALTASERTALYGGGRGRVL